MVIEHIMAINFPIHMHYVILCMVSNKIGHFQEHWRLLVVLEVSSKSCQDALSEQSTSQQILAQHYHLLKYAVVMYK